MASSIRSCGSAAGQQVLYPLVTAMCASTSLTSFVGSMAATFVPREHLVNKLKSMGFKFRGETEHVVMFSHPQTKARVQVRRKANIDAVEASHILRQAG